MLPQDPQWNTVSEVGSARHFGQRKLETSPIAPSLTLPRSGGENRLLVLLIQQGRPAGRPCCSLAFAFLHFCARSTRRSSFDFVQGFVQLTLEIADVETDGARPVEGRETDHDEIQRF